MRTNKYSFRITFFYSLAAACALTGGLACGGSAGGDGSEQSSASAEDAIKGKPKTPSKPNPKASNHISKSKDKSKVQAELNAKKCSYAPLHGATISVNCNENDQICVSNAVLKWAYEAAGDGEDQGDVACSYSAEYPIWDGAAWGIQQADKPSQVDAVVQCYSCN